MRRLLILLGFLFAPACVVGECEPIEPQGASLTCFYQGGLVAVLALEVQGEAAGGNQILAGEWKVNNVDGLECLLVLD